MKELLHFLLSRKATFVTLSLILAIIASLQVLTTEYNNYLIFSKSFHHLIEGKDLYIPYHGEYWDLYKYSPSFAAFFGLFALLPDWLGVTLWNMLNAIVLVLAIYRLPGLSEKEKGLIVLLFLIELMTSLQNVQSNALVAGLLIFAFVGLERTQYLSATFSILSATFIKLFGIVALLLLCFYPGKGRLVIACVGWAIVLLLFPLLFIDLSQYSQLLQSYWQMLVIDHALSYGYSVMGWLQAWFGINGNKLPVTITGALILLLPLIRTQMYPVYQFKLGFLASLLIWVVIFNHRAESPTFVIAMAGVAIWFISSPKNMINVLLCIFAFMFTSLSPTDLFPISVREGLVKPYVLKAFPCILIWLRITYSLLKMKPVV